MVVKSVQFEATLMYTHIVALNLVQYRICQRKHKDGKVLILSAYCSLLYIVMGKRQQTDFIQVCFPSLGFSGSNELACPWCLLSFEVSFTLLWGDKAGSFGKKRKGGFLFRGCSEYHFYSDDAETQDFPLCISQDVSLDCR